MVSLTERQALADMAEADPRLKMVQLLLSGERVLVTPSGGVHDQLLSAIATNDASPFLVVASEIEQRKIETESDWCHDDYLLFLLILGKLKFGCSVPFLSKVIEVRGQNSNPIPLKINGLFAALNRGEFGIDGELGFLKIPFLHLIGKLQISPSDARRALDAMSAPGLLGQMSPFLKLLSQKAHDLVLLERQPLPTETVAQLVEGFEKHAKNLSMRQWWRVITALPGRLIWAGVVLLIPFLCGVGYRFAEPYISRIWEVRTRPESIVVTGIHEADQNLPPEAQKLSRAIAQPVAAGRRSLVLVVQTMAFTKATPQFVVEVSHPEKPIRSAFAFTVKQSEGLRDFTIVPVQRDGGRFRVIMSEQLAGQALSVVLEFEVEEKENAQNVSKGITLRPID